MGRGKRKEGVGMEDIYSEHESEMERKVREWER